LGLQLDFKKLDGLIPAVIQDSASGRVLMLGFMNEESFHKTLESGNVTFFSRSRNKLWMKGESSGHVLQVVSIATDCDDDSLLIQVVAHGPGVCHAGYESCFYRTLNGNEWLESEKRTYDPKAVYGASK
jgi:phosphoribosyl-AMP cyclohydrolase